MRTGPRDKLAAEGGLDPGRPTRSGSLTKGAYSFAPGYRNATRDERRVALLEAMQPDRVLDYAGYVRRVRSRLDAQLLEENPDQAAGAPAWESK